MRADFAKVANWARTYHIAPSRIVLAQKEQLEASRAQIRQRMVQTGLRDAGVGEHEIDQRLGVAHRQRGLRHTLDRLAAAAHESPRRGRAAGIAHGHAAMRGQLVHAGRYAGALQVRRRGHEHDRQPADAARHEIAVVDDPAADPDVETFGHQCAKLLR